MRPITGSVGRQPSRKERINAQVQLGVDPTPPRVGQPVHLTFHLSRNGQPLDSLGPYLVVAGHLVASSQDLQESFHTHPGEMPMSSSTIDHMEMPMAAPGSRFGPDV